MALQLRTCMPARHFGPLMRVCMRMSYIRVPLHHADKEVDAACLAARPASECLTILLDQLEVSGHSPQQPPPAAGPGGEGAAAGGSEATNHATTVWTCSRVCVVFEGKRLGLASA